MGSDDLKQKNQHLGSFVSISVWKNWPYEPRGCTQEEATGGKIPNSYH